MTNKADITLALEDHKIINSDPLKWATLEIIVSPFRAVRLYVGNRHGGKKEVHYKIQSYHLKTDGSCYIYEGYMP